MLNSLYSKPITSFPSLLREGKNNSVILFGEMLADIFPDRTVLGGAPFSVARHLKAFGQNPVLITRLGNDALRDKMVQVMSDSGIETLGIQYDQTHPTGQVKIHIENGSHRFEILPLQAYDFIHSGVAHMAALSVNPVLFYYGTLAQRHDVSARALNNLLRGSTAAKFLDINLRTPWYTPKILRDSLLHADIVKLNDVELIELARLFEIKSENSGDIGRELAKKFKLTQVIVTCGKEGAWMIDAEGKQIDASMNALTSPLVDTVGAGDGFASVCILGALHGWPMETTLKRANSFAAAICGIRGAVPDHVDFYQLYIKEWDI